MLHAHLKILLAIICVYPGSGLKLVFFPTFLFFCVDHESSNVFKETTEIMDNEESKQSYKDLPAEGTAVQKSLEVAPSPQKGTVRREDPCTCKESNMLHKLEFQ